MPGEVFTQLPDGVAVIPESHKKVTVFCQAWDQAGVDERCLSGTGLSINNQCFMAGDLPRQFFNCCGASEEYKTVGDVIRG